MASQSGNDWAQGRSTEKSRNATQATRRPIRYYPSPHDLLRSGSLRNAVMPWVPRLWHAHTHMDQIRLGAKRRMGLSVFLFLFLPSCQRLRPRWLPLVPLPKGRISRGARQRHGGLTRGREAAFAVSRSIAVNSGGVLDKGAEEIIGVVMSGGLAAHATYSSCRK